MSSNYLSSTEMTDTEDTMHEKEHMKEHNTNNDGNMMHDSESEDQDHMMKGEETNNPKDNMYNQDEMIDE